MHRITGLPLEYSDADLDWLHPSQWNYTELVSEQVQNQAFGSHFKGKNGGVIPHFRQNNGFTITGK